MALGAIVAPCGPAAARDRPNSLALEATIPLPDTSGRIDHLAIDLTRKRLLVAELGNGSVDVVDLTERKVVHRFSGLREPQGVVHVPKADLIAITGGGDGTVRLFSAGDFATRGTVRLDSDADNVRLDPASGAIVIGHGRGGLAIIDPVAAVTLSDFRLPAHPEAFELAGANRVYVNIPDAHQIAVVDLSAGKSLAQWPISHMAGNFPMALGPAGTVAVAFRSPPRLVLYDPANGDAISANDTCRDADDIFFDAMRQRYYVSCGSGAIDVFQSAAGGITRLGNIATEWGARTSLFVPGLDRLFLAVRAGLLSSNAAIQIYRPEGIEK